MEWELQSLADAGIRYQLNQKAWVESQVVLHVWAKIGDEETEFLAVYPDSYPELRFEVYAPSLALPKHQNLVAKNLCLIGRDTAQWQVDDNLADFIKGRLPLVLRAAAGAGVPEIPQGEPVTAYYPYQDGAVVFVPERVLAIDFPCTKGHLRIALQGDVPTDPLRGVIYQIQDESGTNLFRLDGEFAAQFTGPRLLGRWVRLPGPPIAAKGDQAVKIADQHHPGLSSPKWQRFGERNTDVVGMVFPEEVMQGSFEDGWLFVVKEQNRSYFVRTQRLSEDDLLARIPETRGTRRRTVAVVGLGGLGAPSAIELARGMIGELRLLDRDFVELGTSVRWPLGLTVTGLSKVRALEQFISRNFPFTKVVSYQIAIGEAGARRQAESESAVLVKMFERLDLLFEASAEYGVQHFLSNLARSFGVPQVYTWATQGAWGGLVARVIPGRTGCWHCLQLHLERGSIPSPQHSPTGLVQPRGCADRTFTGSGFDLLPLVAQAVRLAVQTLLVKSVWKEGDYPDSAEDVYVLDLRNEHGSPIVPTWRSFTLTVHDDCPYCGNEH